MKLIIPVIAFLAIGACAQAFDTERANFINEINSIEGITWTAGVNSRFAGKPVGYSKSMLGVKADSKDYMEAAILTGAAVRAPELSPEQIASIPDSFDSATNWPQCSKVINDIRDQSNCGCCWAFGGAEAASDRMCIATNATIMYPLSAQELCFCASWNGCGGGDLFTPWAYIQSTGLVTGGQYNGTGPFGSGLCSDFSLPHCHHHGPQRNDPYPDEGAPGCPSASSPSCPQKCDASATAPHNDFQNDRYTFKGSVTNYDTVEKIQMAIMTDGPVEAAFSVYSDFENYVSGVYQHTSGSFLGGHAIRIVGWGVDNGTKYWKVANSWNPYWGENGYFRIVRGTDDCGIEDEVTASSMGATWGKMN